MYHSVSESEALYVVRPNEFAWQMQYLKDNNFNVISLVSLVDLLMNKKEILPKTVVLTFDDGYEDNYLNVFPILKEYNFPATIFVSVDFVGDYYVSKSQNISFKMLNWEQIQEMHQSGLIDIQPHTISHPKLAKITKEEAEREIMESKKMIDEKLNKICRLFAYPYGSYSKETLEILQKNNFIGAVTVKRGFVDLQDRDRLLELNRNFVYFYCSRAEFKYLAK